MKGNGRKKDRPRPWQTRGNPESKKRKAEDLRQTGRNAERREVMGENQVRRIQRRWDSWVLYTVHLGKKKKT